VREELSIAKVRQKADAGFRILPVLLDDVPLPPAVSYIKAADFREWQSPEAYREAILHLLRGLGVDPSLIDTQVVSWWFAHAGALRRIARQAAEEHSVADLAVGYVQWFSSLRWLLSRERDAGFYEGALPDLRSILDDGACPADRRLDVLREVAESLRSGIPHLAGDVDPEDHEVVRVYRDRVGRMLAMLEELETEVLTTVSPLIA
jgi:hypothetical protein